MSIKKPLVSFTVENNVCLVSCCVNRRSRKSGDAQDGVTQEEKKKSNTGTCFKWPRMKKTLGKHKTEVEDNNNSQEPQNE